MIKKKEAILFWSRVFPRTFDSVMKEAVVKEYSKDLFNWAQGERGFPYRMEMLKIYSSEKLKNHIKIIGVDGVAEVIKKKLEKVGVNNLVSLAISNFDVFDVKATVHQALESEVAQLVDDIPLLLLSLEDWLRSYEFSSSYSCLETVVRNIVRLTNVSKIVVERTFQGKVFEQINKLGATEKASIGKAGLHEFLSILKPGMSMIYDGTSFIVQLMTLLFNVEPDFANTMFVKLVEKYGNSDYKDSIVPLVHNILHYCVRIGDDEPYLESKARGLKKMLEDAIAYNVTLRAIRDGLFNLVGNARVFLLHGCKDVFNELGDLYVTVESIYKSTQ